MAGGSGSGSAAVSRPTIVETQIKPPPIPPPTSRPPTTGLSSAGSSTHPVATADSKGKSVAGKEASAALSTSPSSSSLSSTSSSSSHLSPKSMATARAVAETAKSTAEKPGSAPLVIQETPVLPPVPPSLHHRTSATAPTSALPSPATATMIQETPVHPPSIPMSAFTFQSAAPLSKESAISGSTPVAGTHTKVPLAPTGKATKASSRATTKSRQQRAKSTRISPSTVQSMQSQPLTTQQQQQQRAWSPPRPPLSPILPAAELPPHLAPTTTGSGTFYTPNFVSGRAIFTHTEAARAAAAQRASAAVAAAAASAAIESVAGDPHLADSHVATSLPPAPLPIDFASNTDVLALQSTISILQLQKKKATADIRALQQAKVAALAQPEAFLRQLQDIQQGTQQGRQTAVDDSDNGSSSDSDVDAGDEINGGSTKIKEADVDLPTEDPVPTPGRSFATAKGRLQHQQQSPLSQTSSSEAAPGVPDLRKLPQPQNIVRMPPINWNKYAVVGEGLEKLHADQIRRPPVGAPAAATLFMENGQSNQALYKFQGGLENAAAAADTAPGAPEYQGIASPYDPLKDVLDPAGTAAALVPTAAVFATSANGVDATTSSAVPSTVTASIRRRSQSSATRR